MRFILSLILLVGLNLPAATPQIGGTASPIPQSLPIGKNFLNCAGVKMSVGVGNGQVLNGRIVGSMVSTNFPYNPSMGSLESVAQNAVALLAPTFVPLPGTEEYPCGASVTVDQFFGSLKLPIACNDTIILKRVGDSWVVPDKVKMLYNSPPVYVPGLKWAKFSPIVDGVAETPMESPNGAYWCPEMLPGGSQYDGPDILYLNTWAAIPGLLDGTLTGTEQLWFDDARTVWGIYDLVDGALIASSEPQPTRIAIQLVPIAPGGQVSLQGKPLTVLPKGGVKLTVANLKGQTVTFEHGEALVGPWQTLDVVLSGSTGQAETVDADLSRPARFYRAKIQ